MLTPSYIQGQSQALTKLGFSAAVQNMAPRVIKRMAMGAGMGGIASSMAGGEFVPGAMMGAGTGMLMGALPTGRNRTISPANKEKLPARFERYQQYLLDAPKSYRRNELENRALSRDLTLGAVGGAGGGLLSRVISGPKETAPQEPAYPPAY